MVCQYCGNIEFIKKGIRANKNGNPTERLRCKNCRRMNSAPSVPRVGAKILLLDIETNLMEGWFFQPKTRYIRSEQVSKDWSIICWNAKWLFDTESIGEVVTPKEAVNRKDKRILERLWELLDEANIVVHQNGKSFDIPHINWRLLKAGYPPPSYYQQIDTKEVMVRNFGASYNSQDWLTKELGLPPKREMHFEDWIKCIVGTKLERRTALQKMFVYNRDDVLGLEELYLYIRPWIPAHANLGIYTDVDKNVCPNCASTELRWNGKTYATPLGIYEAFRCGNCQAIGRSTKKKYRIKGVDVRN